MTSADTTVTSAGSDHDSHRVVVSAPGKLMLTGSYAVVHGHPAVVTAINQRLSVEVEFNKAGILELRSAELAGGSYQKPLADLGKGDIPRAARFVEMTYCRFLERFSDLMVKFPPGVTIVTRSDFSSSFGFGSSSAVTVAFAKALLTLYGVSLTNHDIFGLCYQVVTDVQGVGSGFDLAAAIWGQTLLYVTPAKVVELISVNNLPIIVGYTGIKADTPILIQQVNKLLINQPEVIQTVFAQIGQCSRDVRAALFAQDWQTTGQILRHHHSLVAQLGVSCEKLDTLVAAACAAGAYGATLSGAGGGDCMLAIIDPRDVARRQAVTQAIAEAGGEVIAVEPNAEGVRVEVKNVK